MIKCTLCLDDHYVIEDSRGYCEFCAKKHPAPRVPSRTEPVRPMIPCMRCSHGVFVRCQMRPHAVVTGVGVATATQPQVPLSAAYTRRVERESGSYLSRAKVTVHPMMPIGIFEAYICRKCGYTDLYARDAAQIPIGPEHGTEEIRVESGSPYR